MSSRKGGAHPWQERFSKLPKTHFRRTEEGTFLRTPGQAAPKEHETPLTRRAPRSVPAFTKEPLPDNGTTILGNILLSTGPCSCFFSFFFPDFAGFETGSLANTGKCIFGGHYTAPLFNSVKRGAVV